MYIATVTLYYQRSMFLAESFRNPTNFFASSQEPVGGAVSAGVLGVAGAWRDVRPNETRTQGAVPQARQLGRSGCI